MRELKFRAWNLNRQRMQEVRNMTFREDWIGCNGDDSIGINYLNGLTREFILMQYTGLKDKNGVEIYEGDIVMSISQEDGENILEVMWHQYERIGSGFSFVDPNTNDDDFYHDTIEVIGNIYENPELLK